MNEEAERLAGIEPGDSNEVCLAKTVLAMDAIKYWSEFEVLMKDAEVYAAEVLSARE